MRRSAGCYSGLLKGRYFHESWHQCIDKTKRTCTHADQTRQSSQLQTLVQLSTHDLKDPACFNLLEHTLEQTVAYEALSLVGAKPKEERQTTVSLLCAHWLTELVGQVALACKPKEERQTTVSLLCAHWLTELVGQVALACKLLSASQNCNKPWSKLSQV